jgi:hypothetical protein
MDVIIDGFNPYGSRQAGNGEIVWGRRQPPDPIYNHTHDLNDISRYVKADQGTGQQFKADICA